MLIFSARQKKILLTCVFFAALSVVLAYVSVPSGALEVHFLDVGQGDAIFIQTPSGRQVLIDGGRPEAPVLAELAKFMPFYDRHIDMVAATHMDADHIGGLINVLENFEVDMVLVGTDMSNSPVSDKFWRVVKEKGVPVVLAQKDDRFTLDEQIHMTVLHPSSNFKTDDDNDLSLVFKLVYLEDSFLLTGDIEKRAEYALAQSGLDISADVLKIAHHGSNTSSVKYFLNKVSPKLAVIQVGENRYGHPHPAVIRRLQGINVLRNDLNGVISIYSYGNSI